MRDDLKLPYINLLGNCRSTCIIQIWKIVQKKLQNKPKNIQFKKKTINDDLYDK